MFYRQSVDCIQLVVLTLDGGLLDLNRLRFNYFNRTCEVYGQSITKEQFSFMLGNMKTMYDKSPIQEFISNEEFNRNVEKDLFEYAKLKQNIKKEGVDELLQYCKQKNIKIAVYTTHKSKRAIQYLQLTGLYNKIDFLIGGDCQLRPLPKKDILATICQQMNIPPKRTLVIANFESMVEAALNLYANVIYMPDLVPVNDTIKACVFKVVKNYLEVVNVFLFSKYDNVEMFSPILGMNGEMDRNALYETREKLLNKYQGDEQLVALVNKTYEYFVDKINKEEISQKLSDKQRIFFAFEDDEEFVAENKKETKIPNEKETFDKTKEYKNEDNSYQEDIKNKDVSILSGATSYDPEEMNELIDIINGHLKEEPDEQETKQQEEKKDKTIYDTILNIIFNFLISVIIVLICLVINLTFKDFLNGHSIMAVFCMKVYQIYMMIIDNLFGLIFNNLHNFIQAIPSYTVFIYENSYLSSIAAKALLSVIFNFTVISLIRLLISHLFYENE